jgi:uncharacterized damage-inducible protein DinB
VDESSQTASTPWFLQVKTLGPSHPDAGYKKTRQFYSSMGFQPLEEIPDLWPGNPCMLMIKTLGQRKEVLSVTASDPESDLRVYLQGARDVLIWKLSGLSEYDARRPLTPSGTNLLGLVKHLAKWEYRYFGDTFGRAANETPPWTYDDESPSSDMWASADESREYVVGWYRQACAHADATLDDLDLDAVGRVPWWGENGEVTLGRILVHMTAETQRHAGHADIVRELIDGATGFLHGQDSLSPEDEEQRRAYWNRVEQAAQAAQAAQAR